MAYSVSKIHSAVLVEVRVDTVHIVHRIHTIVGNRSIHVIAVLRVMAVRNEQVCVVLVLPLYCVVYSLIQSLVVKVLLRMRCLNFVDDLDYFERVVTAHYFPNLFLDSRAYCVAVLLRPCVVIVVVHLFGRNAAALAQFVPQLHVLLLER